MGKYTKYPLLPILVIIILGTIPLVYSDSTEEYYMLTLINNERQAQGLEPLTMNSTLSSAAKLHSQDMINRNFFNHVNPDGLTPSDRARNAGYSFIALAENICGNPSIDAGHSSLMGSPSHRINILNPSYKEVGIGIVDGGPYGKMITQLFGTQSGNSVTTPTTTPQEFQGKPDLTMDGIDFSGQAEPLKQISMKITLINSGKKNSENFVFAVFEGPPEKGNLLGKVNISSLYVGQKITANFNWTLPTEGSYTIYFVTDYNNDINEENENNNVTTYPLNIKSENSETNPGEKSNDSTTNSQNNKADLYISESDVSYNKIVYEGTSSLVSFRIRNIGKSTAFGILVKIYVNSDLKASSTVDHLLPSSYTDLKLYLTFANSGNNVIELRIDPESSINEISKSNNYINFNIKVVPKENNSVTTQNTKVIPQDIDLLIYPYYITIEEQKNKSFSINAKIKNKGVIKVNEFSVTFYEKDNNGSNNIFLEKVYLSLDPDEIFEETITFTPDTENGEVIVVIDEENKIKETDETNNIATKVFFRKIGDANTSFVDSTIINTTPKEVNASDSLRFSIDIMETNASNAYLYYSHETNNSFIVLKMDNEGNGIYSLNINPEKKQFLYYYFEVDAENKIIKSPVNSPQDFYQISINYKHDPEKKNESSFLESVKKIFENIF